MFDRLLNVFLLAKSLVEHHPQQFGCWRRLDVGAIDADLSLLVFSPLPSEVGKLGFLRREAGSGPLCPLLDTRDIFGLYFG
jgi:hypothetical protein